MVASRRSFLKRCAALAGGMAVPWGRGSDSLGKARTLELSGRVTGGEGLGGMPVTDGVTVVQTDSDGIRAGRMARRVGTDPMSKCLYEGPEKPEKNSWADPRPTGHLFYAPFNSGANPIRGEATDRFGQAYTERLKGSAE